MKKTHPHMILDVGELEKKSSVSNKVCVVMATCQSPIKFLLWSLYSTLLRSDPDVVDHYNIVINGPDSRIEDTSLQDAKQKFLEELRSLTFAGKPMPITIMRVWSRIGHAQCLEMAIPWVHTENYLLIHDDIVLLNSNWCQEYKNSFVSDESVAIMSNPPLFLIDGKVNEKIYKGTSKLGLPYLNTCFTLCKKPILIEQGCRWWGYHVDHNWDMNDYPDFFEYHKFNKHLDHKIEGEFGCLSMDVGCWVYQKLRQQGYKLETFSKQMVHHFKAISWCNPNKLHFKLNVIENEISDLEISIRHADESGLIPGGWDLYKKYMEKS